MKKQILNLGKTLNKVEQKEINGSKAAVGGCIGSGGLCHRTGPGPKCCSGKCNGRQWGICG
ncbi:MULTISPECIES: hypothetical protein [Tenacibaculum]|uniref:hypothetical protein n=1 Tax=Tenacibaculum TaxID=104267 RepID=UPI000899B9DB|nr:MULTISPECIES: hypothetical protein [unclassified Tenacibaculum]RBW54661.1 hypothetical protein DS884_17065 [Tenacibaculum sp. E3R01]SEE13293.1 hypothetical protein SAMN04487765_1508 [Tenacibaculum sp. MAR_2010_89]